MEREYFHIMSDGFIYLVTEMADNEIPVVHALAYPTGIFADQRVREYFNSLKSKTARYVSPGVYYDERDQRYELERGGKTLPNDKFYKSITFPQPKRCKDVRYQYGYWEKHTKAHGWQRTYEIWRQIYA